MNFFTDFIPDPDARGKCHRCGRWDELDCNGVCPHCTGRERYLSAFGGWNLIGANSEFDVLDGMDTPLANGELNEGFIIGTAFGRRLNERTRGEFELAYRANSGDTLGPDPLDGHMNNWAVMFNLYREFRATENGLIPYIGGGIGLARQNGDFLTEAGQNVDIRDEAFAFQAIIGVAKEVFEEGYLFGEYRYYGNTETDVRIFGVGDVADVQYQSQNFLFGFRWRY